MAAKLSLFLLGDATTLRAKTTQATEVELDITFMYRLKPEFLHLLFAKYPAQNQHFDLINTAKVDFTL